MVRTHNDCKYFASKWFIPLIIMEIELRPSPRKKLPVSSLRSLSYERRTHPLTWLRVPCKKINITTFEIDYFIDETRRGYISLIKVFIYKRVDMTRGINPSVLMPRFSRCLQEEWKIGIGNITATLSANFYNTASKINRTFERQLWDVPFAEGPVRVIQVLHLNAITLAKPFFCKQVILIINVMKEIQLLLFVVVFFSHEEMFIFTFCVD